MIKKLLLYLLIAFSGVLTAQENESNDLQKGDSLKVLRTKLTNEILGNWKMVDDESWALREPSDSILGKMITIEPNQIVFYELYPKAKKWHLVKTEKLVFTDKSRFSFGPFYIVYSNKEVWNYYVDKDSGNLIAEYVGEEHEAGISEVICGGKPNIKYFKLQ